MELYKNSEIKKTTIIIVISNLIIFAIFILVFFISYDKLKIDYIKNKAYTIGTLSRKYPNLENDIVSLSFSNINKKDLDYGLGIIKDYGYSTDLNMKFIGNFNSVFVITCVFIGIAILVITGIHIKINNSYHKRVYIKLNILTQASKEILASNYDVDIDEYKEGEFSKISYAFVQMRDVIKNQMNIINQEKEFLVRIMSDISHQLKTPLASTMIFNEIMLNKNLEEAQRNKFLKESKAQLERMEWMIKSLLKLSKIDAKAIEFRKNEINLNLVIKEVLASLDMLSKENNVQMVFEEHDKAIIYADGEWIKEALINIVKNSIEHSRDSSVRVSIEKSKVFTKVIIKDKGQGIKKEDLPNIFNRFYKSNKPNSIGIGLSLSKSIVESNNGYIEVSSELGVGSKFSVIFY